MDEPAHTTLTDRTRPAPQSVLRTTEVLVRTRTPWITGIRALAQGRIQAKGFRDGHHVQTGQWLSRNDLADHWASPPGAQQELAKLPVIAGQEAAH